MNSKKANLIVNIVNSILFLYAIIISLIVILQLDDIIRLFSIISMYQTLERFSFILAIEFFILLIVNVFFLFRLGNSIRYRSKTGRCVLILYLFLTISLMIFQVIFRFNILSTRYQDFSQYSTINLIIDLVILFFYGVTLISFIVSKSIKKLFMEKEKMKIKSENTHNILKNNLKYRRKFLAISFLLIIIGLAIFTTGISKNQYEKSHYGKLTYTNREKKEFISINETIPYGSTLTENWLLKNQSLIGFAYNYSDSYNLSICELHFNQDLSKLEYKKCIETNLTRNDTSGILGFNQTCYFFKEPNLNSPNQPYLIGINSSGVEINRTIPIPTEFDDYFSNSYSVSIKFLEFEGDYIFMVLSASSIIGLENLCYFVCYEAFSFNIYSAEPIIRSGYYYYEAPSTLWAILGGDPIGRELELTKSTSSIRSSFYGYEINNGKLGNIEKTIQDNDEASPRLHCNHPVTVFGDFVQNNWLIYPIMTYRFNNTIIFDGFTKCEADSSIPNYIFINIGLVHIMEGGFIIFIIIYRTDEYQETIGKIFKKLKSPKIIEK